MKVRGWASAVSIMLSALAVTLAASACAAGGEDGGGSNGARAAADRREGALKFAQCMREHGIDHPDPDANGLFQIEPDQGFDPQSAKFREASEACEKYLGEMGPPPELSEEDRKKLEEQMLAFAKCMREQGIDMPDPNFGDGRFTVEVGPNGIDPSDPDFQTAEEKCREYNPERNPPDPNG